jgi:hypothetical protein
MPTVTINQVDPTDTDVMVNWKMDAEAISSAKFYVATSMANLTAGTYVATGDDSGNCPSGSFQTAAPTAAPYLNPGTQYFCMAECDGNMSEATSFTTLPHGVFLHNPMAKPRLLRKGKASTLSVTLQKNGQPVPNVPVSFTPPTAAGSVAGQPAGIPGVVNSGTNGMASIAFTAGSKPGVYLVHVSAAPFSVQTAQILVFVI